MGNDISNYDVFESILDNNRKARKWTLFWIVALCILAGIIILLAISNARHKKTIADLSITADYKTKIIDSLKGVIQKEVDKKVDSISSYITSIDESIKKIGTEPANNNEEKALQKQKLNNVSNTIKTLNNRVQQIKADFRKERVRLFIQYNEKENAEGVNKLSEYLKRNEGYFVAPVELVDSEFPMLIKVYNFSNEAEEMRLKEIISKIFGLPVRDIGLAHIDSDPSVKKQTIEIWISTKRPKAASKP